MKQDNLRLGEELGKLINNTLSKEGGVYLPQIGTLAIEAESEEEGAQRQVKFYAEKSMRSLISVIKDSGNFNKEQATQIYEKWIKGVVGEETITIVGVGVLAKGEFTATPELLEKINAVEEEAEVAEEAIAEAPAPPEVKAESAAPQRKYGYKKRSEKRSEGKKSPITMWIIIALVLAVVIVAMLIIGSATKRQPTVEEVATEQVCTQEEVAPEPTPEPTPAPAPKVRPTTPLARFEVAFTDNSSKHRYHVVCGVFRSKKYAGSLILDLEKRYEDIECVVYPREYGYMVSVFESNDFYQCNRYLRNIQKEHTDDAWILDVKKM